MPLCGAWGIVICRSFQIRLSDCLIGLLNRGLFGGNDGRSVTHSLDLNVDGNILEGLTVKQLLEVQAGHVTVDERNLGHTVDGNSYLILYSTLCGGPYQLVIHGHFTVNGKKVNIPSQLIKAGDVLAVKETSRDSAKFKTLAEAAATANAPKWLEVKVDAMSATVLNLPAREDVDFDFNEQLIVELYSK